MTARRRRRAMSPARVREAAVDAAPSSHGVTTVADVEDAACRRQLWSQSLSPSTPATSLLPASPPLPLHLPPAAAALPPSSPAPPPPAPPQQSTLTPRACGVSLHLAPETETGYEGVSVGPVLGRFTAVCFYKGNRRFLGTFDSALEGAICYAKVLKALKAQDEPPSSVAPGVREREHKGFEGEGEVPLDASEVLLPAQAARQQRDSLQREVAAREAQRRALAESAKRAHRQTVNHERKEAMARRHRDRQAAMHWLPLRERRSIMDQKMAQADERRRAYLGRFVGHSKAPVSQGFQSPQQW